MFYHIKPQPPYMISVSCMGAEAANMEARIALEEAWHIRQEVLGEHHPGTQRSRTAVLAMFPIEQERR